ncbi:hypothetical protein L596_003427 [Steinernema carpocapsae]|uniref:Kazal-like domain-containing protein n=1 Tax=Steinernema carpocapsae TaxID=34508 RepID=A0A4U8UU51_STECR|nr:hypothetical protein L596_003427 [Steinernema carpocapsae]
MSPIVFTGFFVELKKLHDGACCTQNQCSPSDQPVCDSHGKLYSNYCEYEKQKCVSAKIDKINLEIRMSAPNCSCVQHCTNVVEPVCDSFGQTHLNLCVFSNKKCTLKAMNQKMPELDYLGKCCNTLCSPGRQRFPICDTLGHTHNDFCSLLIWQCEAKRKGDDVFVQFKSFGPCRRVYENRP